MKPYYQDDWATIYHGDCRELLPYLPPVGLVLTDPPYGINYKHGLRKGGIALGVDGHSIEGDDIPFDPMHLIKAFYGVPMIIWGGNHFADRLPASPGWLVWDKRDGGPQMDQADAELAWTNFLTVARVFSRRWSGAVRGGREQAEGRIHVNQKPVALMQWCMGFSDDGTILDLYVGSGSTLVAAKDLGRQSIGVELNEENCEIAAQRLSQEVMALT